ncbi:YheC/YheD family protein [Paenibacillus sp. GD4]|uniref:YheC/YheD family protein n=1 Tax=Paenibacillus sp. GD4 TaxID=3068890 RepID=UPI00279651F2|nr:YheC/YheD family protein [Paenibacillus sp. GD4]MDQ1913909.1 YheC/YheD family protein [Paenibacillus sp. GD4]
MGKIRFHRMFQREPKLRAYLPGTAICNPERLREYLQRYRTVFIKPDGGCRGIGIVKVWQGEDRISFVKIKGKPQSVSSIHALYKKLHLSRRPHIVQQAIQLAQINGRPFDIRVMMMRDQRNRWICIGMVAKVAGVDSVITNVARGKGSVMSINKALEKSLGLTGEQAARKKEELIRLASLCTRIYSRTRYEWQIGYDLALDRKAKVWFIESNPRVPAHNLFLKEPESYRKIKQLAAFHKSKGGTR